MHRIVARWISVKHTNKEYLLFTTYQANFRNIECRKCMYVHYMHYKARIETILMQEVGKTLDKRIRSVITHGQDHCFCSLT